ncbi:NUDIX hydrolase [Macrococcus equipercicus]|uniref:NUDIX hydrolase n=1 Tax=Macrococcus equipercicus TaxID=69967 RepID=A0ABQ6R8A3_9STAP|nr:NUDIX hydrolase [Macrococcus equipercicus]KAA1039343.1 NUDIX hydrolase [Macrococcus equipercicus]
MHKKQLASHDYRIFKVHTVELELNHQMGTFYQVDAPDWVTIIAETAGRFIVESQFRIGIEADVLEFPGGVTLPGEDVIAAAVRELQEETGYSGDGQIIGAMHANPAFMTNRCTTVHIPEARQTSTPSPEPFEHITIQLMTLREIEQAIADGRFSNALHIAALHQWLMH